MEFFKDMVPALLIAALAFSGGYQIWRFISVTRNTIRNEHTLAQSAQATVLSKRMDYDNVDLNTRDGGLCHYATFEIDGGMVIELTTGRTGYACLQEGDRGTLCWSGTRMELFEKAGGRNTKEL